MGVLKDYRSQGIGERLALAALQRARDAGLERVELDVYASNGPALGLYEKLGFVVEGVHRRARKLDGQVDDLISMALLFGDQGPTMTDQAIQDHYPDELSHCYGCGRLNEHGLQIKSFWQGDESVCVHTPRPYHVAIPGFVYGGLIASLIDCHGTGTAAAAGYRAEGRAMETEPHLRYVTASLKVDYLRPTPLGPPLELRGRVVEIKGRKVVVAITLSCQGEISARGEVVAVQVPDSFLAGTSL